MNLKDILIGLNSMAIVCTDDEAAIDGAIELLKSQEATIKELESKLLVFTPTRPKTAAPSTDEDIAEIQECMVRQIPMMIQELNEHRSSTLISLGEIVCNRVVEISVEYCLPNDSSEDTP